ncbi:hypothetical protein K9L16_02815 [Candidatus Pacearchaeota archaeon]|nr:hypothetical protein [Candidatus Pacearchaeota archaeon]
MRKNIALIFFILIFFILNIEAGYDLDGKLMVGVDEGIKVKYLNFINEGETTDFLHMNDSQLENITNMTLEKTNKGKMVFLENLNLTEDVKDNVVDFDSNVNISHNLIFINTSELSSLNKSAELSLYNLSFSNPRILKNGEVCPETICTKIDYSGGTLIFNVNHFTTYSAEETPLVIDDDPLPEEEDEGSSGGGGGGFVGIPFFDSSEANFSLSKELIKVSLKQGEHKMESLVIKNTGNEILDFNIDSPVGKYITVSEKEFRLFPNESKTINLVFYAIETQSPQVILDKININAGSISKNLIFILEINDKNPIFDLIIDADEKAKPGEKINLDIFVENMGDKQNIDLLLFYAIKDFDNNVLFFREESLFIKNTLNLERKILVPFNLKPGTYVVYAEVSYGNIKAVGSDSFVVVGDFYFYLFLILSVLFLMFLLYLFFSRPRRRS